jgi:hypothetical protein
MIHDLMFFQKSFEFKTGKAEEPARFKGRQSLGSIRLDCEGFERRSTEIWPLNELVRDVHRDLHVRELTMQNLVKANKKRIK